MSETKNFQDSNDILLEENKSIGNENEVLRMLLGEKPKSSNLIKKTGVTTEEEKSNTVEMWEGINSSV